MSLARRVLAPHLTRRRRAESPASGELVAMDKAGRLFEGVQAEFIRLRGRRCRTPGW